MAISEAAIKEVTNKNFTFSDLAPRFKNIGSNMGNVFCPFHDNRETPAAKFYWNEYSGIWVLYCFGQCHRAYTAYDYVNLVLCEKYQRYQSPLDFLRRNMDTTELNMQLHHANILIEEKISNNFEDKRDYINTVFSENYRVEDFIEKLYLG